MSTHFYLLCDLGVFVLSTLNLEGLLGAFWCLTAAEGAALSQRRSLANKHRILGVHR